MRILKPAFTMIELIFVIVIIGILASVMIPKMMATRDDARVSTRIIDIGNAITEITAYAVSKATTTSNLCKMSNALSKLSSSNEANCSEGNVSIIKMGGVDCIKLEVIHTITNNDLNVSKINTPNSLCKYLQKEVNPALYEVRLNGNTIKY